MKIYEKLILILIFGFTFFACGGKKEETKQEVIQESKILKTVQIGNQIWTAENLNTQTDSGSWCYNEDEAKSDIYGRLYNWERAKEFCPEGFRLPTLEDWNALIDFYGTYHVVAEKLKSTEYWHEPSLGNEDPNSLKCLPGGLFNGDENFFGEKFSGYYWTATEVGETHAMYINLDYDKAEVLQDQQKKSYGFSVRYIKN